MQHARPVTSEQSQSRLAKAVSAGILDPLHKAPVKAIHYQRSFEAAYQEIAEQRNYRRLENLFIEADIDHSAGMSLAELRKAWLKPWIRQTFSQLGVQPHQAEMVFKSMKKAGEHELSLHCFIRGLQSMVGTDLQRPPQELDVQTLRPAYKTQKRIASMGNLQRPSTPTSASLASELFHNGLDVKTVSQAGSVRRLRLPSLSTLE